MFTRLYLHIPFCRRKCPYCAFFSQEDLSGLEQYKNLLLKEIRLAEQNIPFKPLDSIYFGGGTPSLLDPDFVGEIIAEAGQRFGLTENAEITLEANPGTVDLQTLNRFRKAGINRLSMGVQSMDDQMLVKLGRIHTSTQAREAYTTAREAGFENIGIDLIHALPGQTLAMWLKELEQVLELAPEHISIYGLTVEEDTPFAKDYPEQTPLLPDEETAALMYEAADKVLTAAGYEHYEIANYARPGYCSRHNSGYWQRDGYLGLGAGSHSLLLKGNYGIRFSNVPDLKEYSDMIQQGKLPRKEVAELTREEAMAEFMFLGLRMSEGVELAAFQKYFQVAPEQVYGIQLEKLIGAGLLQKNSGRICLTRRGMILSNQVFVSFLL